VAQDISFVKAFGDVTADVLKRLGVNMDYAAIDWGTVIARRAQKTPPGQGGWHMFLSWSAGADWTNPTSKQVRANGDDATCEPRWINDIPPLPRALARRQDPRPSSATPTVLSRGRMVAGVHMPGQRSTVDLRAAVAHRQISDGVVPY
jgi:hypothetical protein